MQRGKNGRARADNDGCPTMKDPQPFLDALLARKRTVQYRNTPWKPCGESLGELRRKPDFGDENEAGIAARQRVFSRLNINLRLSASGDAV